MNEDPGSFAPGVALGSSADVNAVSDLFRVVLTGLPYYNEKAVRAELARFGSDELHEWAADVPHGLLVAKDRQVIIGFCISRPDDDLIWLEWFGVHPSFRRAGIASALLRSLERSARVRKAHKIWCDSRTGNVESIAILQHHGYRQLCTLENHWHHQDYHLWEKQLS